MPDRTKIISAAKTHLCDLGIKETQNTEFCLSQLSPL